MASDSPSNAMVRENRSGQAWEQGWHREHQPGNRSRIPLNSLERGGRVNVELAAPNTPKRLQARARLETATDLVGERSDVEPARTDKTEPQAVCLQIDQVELPDGHGRRRWLDCRAATGQDIRTCAPNLLGRVRRGLLQQWAMKVAEYPFHLLTVDFDGATTV
jgi:hypothetical protein